MAENSDIFICFDCTKFNESLKNKETAAEQSNVQHMRTHTKDKPFRSDHPGCEWTFKRRNNLTSHQLTHFGREKPFKCNFLNCNKRYTQQYRLRQHQKHHQAHCFNAIIVVKNMLQNVLLKNICAFIWKRACLRVIIRIAIKHSLIYLFFVDMNCYIREQTVSPSKPNPTFVAGNVNLCLTVGGVAYDAAGNLLEIIKKKSSKVRDMCRMQQWWYKQKRYCASIDKI